MQRYRCASCAKPLEASCNRPSREASFSGGGAPGASHPRWAVHDIADPSARKSRRRFTDIFIGALALASIGLCALLNAVILPHIPAPPDRAAELEDLSRVDDDSNELETLDASIAAEDYRVRLSSGCEVRHSSTGTAPDHIRLISQTARSAHRALALAGLAAHAYGTWRSHYMRPAAAYDLDVSVYGPPQTLLAVVDAHKYEIKSRDEHTLLDFVIAEGSSAAVRRP